MLYIDNIDEASVRFRDSAGNSKVLYKNLEAISDEKELVWIRHTDLDEYRVNSESVENITINGVVYTTAEDFVVAFNLLISSSVAYTTTTTTAVVTTTTTT